jgi:uncharacterized membrane protein
MATITQELEPAAERPLAHRLGWLGIGLGAAAILALRRADGAHGRVVAAAAAVAGLSALDLLCGRQLRERIAGARTRANHVRCTIQIDRTPQDLYRFWRELQNLPRFLQRIEAIEVGSSEHSHWRAVGPGGTPVEWDVDLIADEPQHRIAWCSARDSAVFHCGSVRFEPARSGRGTSVRMDVHCTWSGTGWRSSVGRLLGLGLAQEMTQDLRRFKQLMETGETAPT